jgi:molybdate transport system substrate-binding protein
MRGDPVSRRTRVLVVLALAGLVAACGNGKDDSKTEIPNTTAVTAPQITGDINVYAASSLTDVFTTLQKSFEKKYPKAHVIFNFGASSTLAQQVNAGAPADVFASADEDSMITASQSQAVGDAYPIAHNIPQILVAKGNPKSIRSVSDLGRSDVKFGVCAPDAPCGKVATKVLQASNITRQPTSVEADVKALATKVTLGELDAGIVYVTEVKAAVNAGNGQGVELPPDPGFQTTDQIAPVAKAKNSSGAQAWIAWVRSDEGLSQFANYGFGGV